MGHQLSGDLGGLGFPRFERFPVMPWVSKLGENLAVPRFEWFARDGESTHFAMLGELGPLELPAWLQRDGHDGDFLRVPTWVEPAWFLREALPVLRDAVRGRHAGRLAVRATFAVRLHARELPRLLDKLNAGVGKTAAPLTPESFHGLPVATLWDALRARLPEHLAALDARLNPTEGAFLLLCAAYLVASGEAFVFVDDDASLDDAHRVRHFRLTSSRTAVAGDLVATVKELRDARRRPERTELVSIGVMDANGLAEGSAAAAALFVASARLQLDAGAREQARVDLAWARHLAPVRGAWAAVAKAVEHELAASRTSPKRGAT